MKKIVVGLLGRQGSGKGTFVEALRSALPGMKVAHIKSGGLLVDIIKMLDLPVTRFNLQKLVNLLKDNFGNEVVSNAIRARIEAADCDIAIFDAVRWKADEEMIRKFPVNLSVYIDTEKELRYQRLKDRREKEDETGLAREQFEKAELDSTEVDIPDIGSRADVVIANNGTENQFLIKTRFFCQNHIKNGLK